MSQSMSVPQQPMYPPPHMQMPHGIPQGAEQGVNRQAIPVQPQPCVELKGAVPQLIDPNMITEAMRRHFRVQLRPLERPVYRKPYPDWVDKVQFPKGFRTPDFTTFSREDDKSTMEHVSRFIAQCPKAS